MITGVFKKLLFSFLILMYGFTAQGQCVLQLPEEPLAIESPGFRIDTVIDARQIKPHIGVIQEGKTKNVLECNFPEYLPTYLKGYLQRNFSAQGEPLTLIIDELWVSDEKKGIGGLFDVTLAITLARKDSLGNVKRLRSYRYDLSAGTIKKEAFYMKTLQRLFKIYLRHFSGTDWKNQQHESVFQEWSGEPRVAELFEKEEFTPGGYTTITELLNNQPTIAFADVKKRSLFENRIVAKVSKNAQKGQKLLAYSDGKQLYLNAETYFKGATYFALVRETGRFFLIDDPLDPMQYGVNCPGFIVDFLAGVSYACNDRDMIKILQEFPKAKEKYLSKENRKTVSVWRSCIVYLNRSVLEALTKE